MRVPFWKMHGAGNDFILMDDRALALPAENADWLVSLARRRTGIGCEGIILLQPATEADFRMRFYNPDGHSAEMCGNGARCAARLAVELGIAPARMTLATDAGVLEALVTPDTVRLALPDPTEVRAYFDLSVDGAPISCGAANTGVPHVVLELQDLDEAPVMRLGPTIRNHPSFIPVGTNVNFVQRVDQHELRVRTYERGVEAESGACGTGVTAAAIVMALRQRVTPPVSVATLSGDCLTIGFSMQGDRVSHVTLSGPAVHVYEGTLPLPG
ncbi:MAG: diaminopimelate epimerase [Lentisphaerae bacterium]|nr:diaminopimelate epimerase [Lentisphaerota bacterium]